MFSPHSELTKFYKETRYKIVEILYDIETLLYNKEEGRKNPKKYKSIMYSFAISIWVDETHLKRFLFPNFHEFLEHLFDSLTSKRGRVANRFKVVLNAHNGNKFDGHFLLTDLRFHYPSAPYLNLYMDKAINNDFSRKKKDVTKEERQNGIILQKRVKTSNNLELTFYLEGIEFSTCDNWVKTNSPLRILGEKAKRKGLLTDDELKTELDYSAFDLDVDMGYKTAMSYAKTVFNQLNQSALTYIENDVIILGIVRRYYSELFPGFDYSKMTFTSNILESYKTSHLSEFQMLGRFGKGSEKIEYISSNYLFHGQNLYDFLKTFYFGGCNVYNDQYVGKLVEGEMFSFDLNSSYNKWYYEYPVPTFLVGGDEYSTEKPIKTDQSWDTFYLYRVTKTEFERIISQNRSKFLRKAIMKYYRSSTEYVNINTNTIRTLTDVFHVDVSTIKVVAWLKYECKYFDGREQVGEYYRQKSQSKYNTVINMPTPLEYTITDIPFDDPLPDEEVEQRKVLLNGLAGIPALRAFFNKFTVLENGEIQNDVNGYKNNERNIIFSIFTTSGGFNRLLSVLRDVPPELIDKYVLYGDTDSWYAMWEIKKYLHNEDFDPIILGKWGYQEDIAEGERIVKLFVLNHKKYTYITNTGKIKVKSGGVRLDRWKVGAQMKKGNHCGIEQKFRAFDIFLKTQFRDGGEIVNTKSIMTETGNIAVYDSVTELSVGKKYPLYYTKDDEEIREAIIDQIRKAEVFSDDIAYIETPFGAMSQKDIYPATHETENKHGITTAIAYHRHIKEVLQDEREKRSHKP